MQDLEDHYTGLMVGSPKSGDGMARAAKELFNDSGTPKGSATAAKKLQESPYPKALIRSEPFIIGVAGGTASGKTTVCTRIIQALHDQRVVLISMDSFYKGLTQAEMDNVSEYNFDHPNAFDAEAILHILLQLKECRVVEVPEYDFVTHQRSEETRQVNPADVIIIEGILLFQFPEILETLNMKIFVDTDDDVRLARRIQRDTVERGRDVNGVIAQYTKFVKPMFDQFVAPSKKVADVIIPWARGDNSVAIDLIVQHIRTKLGQHDLRRVYSNLDLLPSNYQTRGMHTIIRCRETHKTDFVFYADRLIRLIVEHGLGQLPFKERAVTTPTGTQYVGVEYTKGLCGVSIIRSGESMENALRACCKGVKIGKILIHRTHTNEEDKEKSALIYHKLPKDISKRHVLLLDPILATGHSAVRAIQVIMEHGVPESKIIFLTLIAAPEGIAMICESFPKLRVITSEIDYGVNNDFRVVPGIGEFGDRYFGTEDDDDMLGNTSA